MFKIGILGDHGVGKSTYLQRLLTGEFLIDHYPTEISTILNFQTTDKIIPLQIQEATQVDKLDFSDGIILMFDLHNQRSFDQIPKYLEQIKQRFGEIPLIICGNKVDIKHKQIKKIQIRQMIHSSSNKYFDLSAKSNYNFDKPFLYLIPKICPVLQSTGFNLEITC